MTDSLHGVFLSRDMQQRNPRRLHRPPRPGLRRQGTTAFPRNRRSPDLTRSGIAARAPGNRVFGIYRMTVEFHAMQMLNASISLSRAQVRREMRKMRVVVKFWRLPPRPVDPFQHISRKAVWEPMPCMVMGVKCDKATGQHGKQVGDRADSRGMIPEPARRRAGQHAQANSVQQADCLVMSQGNAFLRRIDEHDRQSGLQELPAGVSIFGVSPDRANQRPQQHTGYQA